MFTNRTLMATLALILAVGMALVGCTPSGAPATTTAADTAASSGDATATTAATTGEVKTFTMFEGTALTTTTPAWDTPIGKKITELTGVRLEIEYLVGQDLMTKANLMTTSGDYPDLVSASDNGGIFIAAGAFIKLDDLIDKYGTNLKKIYRPSEFELMKLQNGAIYILATNRPSIENLYPSAGWYLNYDVLKKNNFPVVTKISQYKDLIVNYMKDNPQFNGANNIGFTIPTEGTRVSALQYGGARFLGGYPNDGPTCVDQETLVAKINMTQDFTKEYLRFMNEMWNMGYMDKEAFMQTNDQYLAKVASGNVIGMYDQRGMVVNALGAMDNDEKLHDRTLVAFPVVLDGITKEYYRGPYAFSTSGISISTSCKDPDGAMQFLDRMAADDIQMLNYWGIEGEDYTLTDGKFTRTADQWTKSFDVDYIREKGITQFNNFPRYEGTDNETYGKFQNGNWVNPALNQEYNDIRYKDYEKEMLKNYNVKTFCDFFAPAYPARYQPGWAARQQMPQDSEEFTAVQKALDLATQYHAIIVQAKADEFDAKWDEYQKQLSEVAGLTSYEEKVTQIIQDSAQYYKN